MIDRFVDAFKARMQEGIREIERSIGHGGCANHEVYRGMVGLILGFERAITIAEELAVKLGEDEDAG